MLAAGGSRRLGQPKQLLPWRGTTLLHHAAQTALAAGVGPVIVMLGAHADACEAAVRGLELAIVRHAKWEEGLGSTIAAAITSATKSHPDASAFILMTCDQPEVRPEHLAALVSAHIRQHAPIAASEYAGTVGVPALFSRELTGPLMTLVGDAGAGNLIRSRPGQVARVPCPAAAFDVDGPGDLYRLK